MSRFSLNPHLALILAQAFWAGNAIAGRAAAGHVPPVALAFWRWVLACLILTPFVLPRVIAHWAAIRREWKVLAAFAGTSVATYNTFLYLALNSSTAVNTTLVSATIPVAIAIVGWVWLKERLGLVQAGGILLSLTGVTLVIAHGDLAGLVSVRLHEGDWWALAAVASWAVYSVMLRRFPPRFEPLVLLFMQIVLGLAWIAPLYAWEWMETGGFDLDGSTIGLIFYVATFPSLLAYRFWNLGVVRLGAQTAGLYTNLIPVFTAFLAALLLGEAVQWFHGVGLLLIAAGIVIVTRR